MEKIVFGIDLGTTYSAVSYVDSFDKPVIMKNRNGKDITPSAIYFSEDGNIVVGQAAKEEADMDPAGYVEFFKRYMGTPFDELPDSVKKKFTIGTKQYRPEELSSLVLKELKRSVDESSLGVKMEQVVITVPAYFNEAQRMATKTAGELAGLQVLEIIKEPLAAAFDYTQSSGDDNKTFLIYDLGGGTFDATVMSISEQEVIEVASEGDSQLGGKDWDQRIFELLHEKFLEEHPDYVFSLGDEKQLLLKSEEIKVKLTNSETTKAKLNFDGEKAQPVITRQDFEDMTVDLLERTLEITDSLIEIARGKGFNIDAILLVGGSTRMPMIKKALQSKYGLEPKTHDPDQAVAKGAAIWAVFAYIKGQKIVEQLSSGELQENNLTKEQQEVLRNRDSFSDRLNTSVASFGNLNDKEIVTAATKTYGVKLFYGDELKIQNIIIKNSPLVGGCISGTIGAGTRYESQSEVLIEIIESDEMQDIVDYKEYMAEQMIGELLLTMPVGLPIGSPIEVTLTLNDQGLINAYAKELTGGRDANAEIQIKGLMTGAEIEDAIEHINTMNIVDEI
ncbi:Hsp70 family protein [Streptococcus suis]|nr:Hsp70 family protein [Streptococcus suis]